MLAGFFEVYQPWQLAQCVLAPSSSVSSGFLPSCLPTACSVCAGSFQCREERLLALLLCLLAHCQLGYFQINGFLQLGKQHRPVTQEEQGLKPHKQRGQRKRLQNQSRFVSCVLGCGLHVHRHAAFL